MHRIYSPFKWIIFERFFFGINNEEEAGLIIETLLRNNYTSKTERSFLASRKLNLVETKIAIVKENKWSSESLMQDIKRDL